MKRLKKVVFITISALTVLLITMILRYHIISFLIDNEVTFVSEETYKAEGIDIIKQEISCGYAVIEMIAKAKGLAVTEESLFEANDKQISTALGKGFLNEMQKQFPNHEIKRFTNLKNSEVITKIEESLKQGNPVPFEFAALYQEDSKRVWTLHFGLVTAIDLKREMITVYNPYGYIEEYTVENFLKATTYQAYEEMESVIKMGFYAGVFSRNTIYIMN